MVSAPLHPKAAKVTLSKESIKLALKDGRSVIVPLAWQPDIYNATAAQRRHFELIADGAVIFWPDVDTYISVRRLLVPDGEAH
jgi:hypothetical protein